MSSNDPQLAWTDEQWNKVQAAVQEAARSARVASTFLPLVGPLPSSTTVVPALQMTAPAIGPLLQRGEQPDRLSVDEYAMLRLATISANVYLKTSEVTDPELASATQMFARAGDLVGRVEDAIVFNGVPPDPPAVPGAAAPPPLPPPPPPPWPDPVGDWVPTRPGVAPVAPFVQPLTYTVRGGTAGYGLVDTGMVAAGGALLVNVLVGGTRTYPEQLVVDAVIDGINALEGQGQYGPFACVMGSELFAEANRPYRSSGALPSDRIKQFLNGPLLRSSTISPRLGVVVALAGNPVDLVIATDINVRFLQLTTEPRYVFRVSERMALRVKQPEAVSTIQW
jgi:uncharacterized linocin/CFP29 family protein